MHTGLNAVMITRWKITIRNDTTTTKISSLVGSAIISTSTTDNGASDSVDSGFFVWLTVKSTRITTVNTETLAGLRVARFGRHAGRRPGPDEDATETSGLSFLGPSIFNEAPHVECA